MDALKPIENALVQAFKGLPQLPVNAKQTLVKYWPILALVLGFLQLVSAMNLWRFGHVADEAVRYVNDLSIAAGNSYVTPQLSVFYYVGIAALIINGALLLAAYAPLKARLKKGWDLLFLVSLINIVYGVILMFDGYYGNFSSLLSTSVGSIIAWYFLFQIRDYYTGAVPKTGGKPATTKTSTDESKK